MEEIDETVERDLFRHDLLDPSKWLRKADALVGVASKLEDELEHAWRNCYVSTEAGRIIDSSLPVYLMLAAYAVENLLKAFIIRSRHAEFETYVIQKHDLPGQLKSHDLVTLAESAGATSALLAYRRDLLRRMARSAVWYGRYPVPLSYDRREPQISHLGGADIDEVRCLLRDLRNEFDTGTYSGAV